jgi:hypothetical protein
LLGGIQVTFIKPEWVMYRKPLPRQNSL